MLLLAPLAVLSWAHLAAAYVPATASSNSLAAVGNATFKGTWKNTESTGSSGIFRWVLSAAG